MKKIDALLTLCIASHGNISLQALVAHSQERFETMAPLLNQDHHNNGDIISIDKFEPHNYDSLDQIDKEKIDQKYYASLQQWYKDNTDIEFFKIYYWSNGVKVVAILGKPKTQLKKYPLIIYNRGGYGEYSKISLPIIYAQLSDFVKNGYVVLGSQYRGNDGGQGIDECGGSDVYDVMNLIPLAEKLNYIDIHHMYMIGYSRGGIMSYMALRQLPQIRAAAIIAGISNVFLFAAQRPDLEQFFNTVIPHIQHNRDIEYTQRSATYWAKDIQTPLFLIHGQHDTVVHSIQSTLLAEELKKLNKPYKLALYPEEDHAFKKHRAMVNQAILDWFAQYQ